MAKFCGKCGSPLDSATGFCPNCDADKIHVQQKDPFKVAGDLSPKREQVKYRSVSKEATLDGKYWEKNSPTWPKRKTPKKRTGRRVAAVILVLALVIGGAGFAGWKMGWLSLSTSGTAVSEGGFALLTGSFTDRKIMNQESALAAIGDVADILGIENVNAEFSECKADTASGNTYYRFYQEYEGIPVYGRSVVVVADEDGEGLSLSGNYVPVLELNTGATASQEAINSAIQEYFCEQLGVSKIDDLFVEEISANAMCIYNMGDHSSLAYQLYTEVPHIGCYETLVDAQEPKVLYTYALLQYNYEYEENGAMDNISANGQEIVQSIDVYRNPECYIMADASRNIEVYKLQGKFWWGYSKNTNEMDEISWVSEEELQEYTNEVDALANVQIAYDYFEENLAHHSTDGNGDATIFIFTDWGFAENATLKDKPIYLDNACSDSNIDENWTAICIGLTKNKVDNTQSANLDVVAHEYTHAVIKFACNLGDQDETSAINEGISDVFGELVEEWKNGSCDWVHGNRTIYKPSVNGYAETVSDTSNGTEDYAHGHSTVISHAAYLMSTGVSDASNLQALTTEDIAHLFYETLETLPSDCTFSQFRSLTQNMAKIMCEQGRLTQKQVQCVSAAFFEVGITPATMLVAKELALDVYGVDGQLYENYTLYVRHHSDAEKKYAGDTVATEGISFPTTGTYELVIVDNANLDNRTSVTIQVTDDGGIKKMPVYTECGTAPVEFVPELMPAPTVSFERLENNGEEYATITARDISGNTVWSITTPSYPMTELWQLEEIGVFDDLFVYNESGTITAVDVKAGELRWKNSEFGGAQIAFTSDEKGIYLCGYYGPSFYAISFEGITLQRIERFDDVCYWPESIELEADRIRVHLVYDSLAPLGYGEHTHYISRDTLQVLPDGGSPERQIGGSSVEELSSLLDEYFGKNFAWNDDDIISGTVSDGRLISNTDVLFDLRVQTKSAEWTHQANALVGTVTISTNTLAGYIEWNDGSRTPFDLSGSSYAESYQTILERYPEYEERSWGKEYTEYALYDIDKNSVPELIVKLANMFEYDVYTYDGQESVLCGEIFDSLLGHTADLYEYGGNGIVIHVGGTGTMRIESIYTQQLVNGKLSDGEYIASTEEISFDELYSILETYTRIKDFYKISDFSPFG